MESACDSCLPSIQLQKLLAMNWRKNSNIYVFKETLLLYNIDKINFQDWEGYPNCQQFLIFDDIFNLISLYCVNEKDIFFSIFLMINFSSSLVLKNTVLVLQMIHRQ